LVKHPKLRSTPMQCIPGGQRGQRQTEGRSLLSAAASAGRVLDWQRHRPYACGAAQAPVHERTSKWLRSSHPSRNATWRWQATCRTSTRNSSPSSAVTLGAQGLSPPLDLVEDAAPRLELRVDLCPLQKLLRVRAPFTHVSTSSCNSAKTIRLANPSRQSPSETGRQRWLIIWQISM
jgi:hypothetical protein